MDKKLEEIANLLVAYYYSVDAELDESENGLDDFHDRSVAKRKALAFAKAILEM